MKLVKNSIFLLLCCLNLPIIKGSISFFKNNWKYLGAAALTSYVKNSALTHYYANQAVEHTKNYNYHVDKPNYPIIYDPGYNVNVFGSIDNYINPFDGQKY